MQLRFLWFALVLLGLGASAARAQNEITVRVGKGSDDPYKVAVQRFQSDMSSAALVEDFYTELAGAVTYNAGFTAMDPAAFLGPTVTERYDKVGIDCQNWRAIGANVLVQGLLQRTENKVRAQYRVWDIGLCQVAGDTGVLEGTADEAWLVARRLADDVVQRFGQQRGVAATQIAFVSDQTGNKEIYLMEADGTRRRQLTRNKGINLFPEWSPDANELAYTTYRSGIPEVRVLGRGSRPSGALVELPALYKKADKIRAVWGPDDGWVTMVMTHEANTDLYLMRRDGREMKRLTEDRSIEVSPTWSPDHKQLAFASDRSGNQQLYIMDMSSGGVRRLTYKGDYNATPAWSPTGEWIAYAARTGTNLDLYLIDPTDGYTVPLMVHERSDESPSWAPDGRKLAFMSDRRGRREVYTIDIDGRNLRRVTQDFGNCSSPTWARWLD